MGAIEQRTALGDRFQVFHKYHAPSPKTIDHPAVVNDLVVDVDRAAEELQGPLQAPDRHVDAGTKPAWVR